MGSDVPLVGRTNVTLHGPLSMAIDRPNWMQSMEHANHLVMQQYPQAALRKIFLMGTNSRNNYADPNGLTEARLIYSETVSDASPTVVLTIHWPTRDSMGRTTGGPWIGPHRRHNGWHMTSILDFRTMNLWRAHEIVRRHTRAQYWYIELWRSRRRIRGVVQSCFMFEIDVDGAVSWPTKVFVGTRDGGFSRGFEDTFGISRVEAGIEIGEAAAAA